MRSIGPVGPVEPVRPAGRADPHPVTGPDRHPVHRGIVAVLVEHEGRPTNPVRDGLRREAYALVEAALGEAGIRPRHRSLVSVGGAGLAALVRPVDEVPKTRLLDTLLPALGVLVDSRNAARPADPPLRLRVAVHSGEVHQDEHGFFGESLDLAFRLIEAPRVREFARILADPVTLVVSEDIFQAIIRHGYDGIDRQAYVPIMKIQDGRRRQIYVHIGSWRGGPLLAG